MILLLEKYLLLNNIRHINNMYNEKRFFHQVPYQLPDLYLVEVVLMKHQLHQSLRLEDGLVFSATIIKIYEEAKFMGSLGEDFFLLWIPNLDE